MLSMMLIYPYNITYYVANYHMSSVLCVCAAIYAVRIVKLFGQTICCHVILWLCRLIFVYYDILIGDSIGGKSVHQKMCPEE